MKRIILAIMAIILISRAAPAADSGGKDDKTRNAGQVIDLDKITILADKLKESLALTASSISVISESDIKEESRQFVKDVLSEYNGITKTEASAFGGQADIRIRGANPNHTVLLIDGVKVYDPSSASGGFNFANLSFDNVEKAEIVRGPQTTLYGSDAMGGVISLESKKPDKPFFEAGIESGSYYTLTEYVNIGSYNKGLSYSFGFSQLDSEGISKADPVTIPNIEETDPYTRKSFAGRLDYELLDNLNVGLTIRNINARYEYDDPGNRIARLRDNDELVGKNDLFVYSIYAEHKPFDFYDYSVTYSYVNNFRRNFDYPAMQNDWYEGTVNRFDYQNNLHIMDYDIFTIGYDYSQDIADSYSAMRTGVTDQPKVTSRNSALYLQNKAHFKEIIGTTQNVRVDEQSQFGTYITYKVDGFFLAPTMTRVRGVWATSFKAPSLYQLYAPATAYAGSMAGFIGGNSALEPEKGRSYELGLDQYLFSKKFKIGVTYFYNRFSNLIKYTTDPVTNQSTYQNASKAKSLGMEYGLEAELFDGKANVSTGFDWTDTQDYTTDRMLVKVPKEQFNFKLKLKPINKLFIGTDVYYKGINFNTGTDKLKPYTKVDLLGELSLTKEFSVYCRIENLLNKHYQETRGFAEPGLSVYGGVKSKF